MARFVANGQPKRCVNVQNERNIFEVIIQV